MKPQPIFLPTGSYEQHGPHLPPDTDTRIAELLAQRLAERFKGLCLPAIPFGCSWEHLGSQTLTLRSSTLAALVDDLAHSLQQWQPRPGLLVLVNWHGGNALLSSLAAEISARDGLPCAVLEGQRVASGLWQSQYGSPADVHAGELETSILLAYWPEHVRQPLPAGEPRPLEPPLSVQPALQALGVRALSPSGVIGSPLQARQERGRAIVERTIERLSQQLQHLLILMEQRA
ncbi:creatininase family protein [Thermogemmatispora sp.]|jgi:creatinine amidohydrolase|uniref:creatininase family protein n=1 Tax=Thermogemmatispora sp. TaxID=1968838 RepID=UPI0019EEF00C|nr:creatininase family protein [Thermogemmatispora sp.]MBE3567811.1 creatininase family protein [Thermogemmatispora sp.]MBX5451822.1 creatininase family protein [Thermogemmatispora sp.]